VVVAGRLVEKPDAVVDRAGLGILGAVIDAPQPGMGDATGAHGARFQRHIEIAAVEPAGAASSERRPDRQHFGMRGGIVERPHAVALGGENGVSIDDHGADRRLAVGGGGFGKLEGEVHR